MSNDLLDRYISEVAQAVTALERDSIWQVTQALFDAWKRSSQVFILGNGGSSSTAAHMANDLNKLTITPGKRRFKAIALTINVPLMTAWSNDASYEDVFAEQLINFIQPQDVVVAISASGNSPNVLKAVRVARCHGATTIGLTGSNGGQLKDLVDLVVLTPTMHICQQEDCHLVIEHAISVTLRAMIEAEPV